MLIERHRTAISRRELSRPFKLALDDRLLSKADIVLDYGCGRGDDLRNLRLAGYNCQGWDPNYFPDGTRSVADVVNIGYVVNVIENQDERRAALKEAWSLSRKLLIVSAQLDIRSRTDGYVNYADGLLSRRATFQKFYSHAELRDWIDASLGEHSLAAGPGVFYVFRDLSLREAFSSSRYRTSLAVPRLRQSTVLFEENRALLESLVGFLTTYGRLPHESEFDCDELKRNFGSLRRAFNTIVSVTGDQAWKDIREKRSEDLLVYLALSRFGGRPQLSRLPSELQRDISAFFSTYSNACKLADVLLFSAGDLNNVSSACRNSSVGKLTPSALYVHETAVPSLAPVLRVYEGCARAYIGSVEGANVIKLHYQQAQVSYLAYPKFDRDPHPSLFGSLLVPLQTFRVKYREYADSDNPPILHRKECFVAPNYVSRAKFERLTRQGENHGLYENIETIGTRRGWEELLSSRGLKMAGHKLVKTKGS